MAESAFLSQEYEVYSASDDSVLYIYAMAESCQFEIAVSSLLFNFLYLLGVKDDIF
jgi:hypothetical protein